jgi:hypothetical protein
MVSGAPLAVAMNMTALIPSLVSANVPGECRILPVFFGNFKRRCPECVVLGKTARRWRGFSEDC